jgi:ABC-type polar amino acid transport system ATPase subunit
MIEISGLRKRLGDRTVLDGVSLRVDAGEGLAVMGPSGAGKTTLLRCLNGLERADAGVVRVGDDELSAAAPDYDGAVARVRRRVGYVFQEWHLFRNRTVLGNVIEAPVHVAGERHADAVASARVLLERVGIAHREAAYPHELSGGEQQRAAIARALAMRPQVLLMDEPTSALDAARVAELSGLLRTLVADGLTLIVVTHDQDFARALGVRVLVLRDGRLEPAPGSAS